MVNNPWIPHQPHPRQQQFLLHSYTPEVLYGGAAGGGKSDALLMAAAQYVETPGYAALLLRRTFPDLMQPDALIPRSKEWWGRRAKWNAQAKRWTFPSGATITFGYLEADDDVYQYQGAAYQFIGIDELTQHTEFRYRYLFSRLRRLAGSEVPLRMRSGSNPGGLGHEWVKLRFIKDRQGRPILHAGRVFVPARLTDNPSLDAASYIASLDHLDAMTRAQLLAGDWDAVAGGRFKREWFRRFQRSGTHYRLGNRIYEYNRCPRFLTVDPAASALGTARSKDPDYTVVSAWAASPVHELIWLDCRRFRKEIPDIVPEIEAAYHHWDAEYVGIEAVAANRAVYQMARRTRMAVKELVPRPGEDKLVRATKAIVLASDGRLWLPESAPWLDEAESELVRFTGDPKQDGHDDIVDTVAYAARLAAGPESRKHQGIKPHVLGGQ